MPKRKTARYSVENRAEALALAECIGGAVAATGLGLQTAPLHKWRAKAAQVKFVTDHKCQLREENAQLKRQRAGNTKEVRILGKSRRLLCTGAGLKYAATNQNRSNPSVARQCPVLCLSCSGYYPLLSGLSGM